MANRNNVANAILGTAQQRSAAAQALSPFAQSQSKQFDVNRPYENFLNRDPNTFLTGSMGPNAPILPVGLDAPDQVTGQPDPRRMQYPVAWNLNMGQPGSEGLKLASFATLRTLGDTYSVARACVERRVGEIVGLDWDIVPTAEAELKMHGDESLRKDWQERREQIVEFFRQPDSDRSKYPDFASWLAAIVEDMVTIDAVAIQFVGTRSKTGGLFKSGLSSLDLLDGSTIRPMLNIHGATPGGDNVAYQQYMWGVPRVDMLSVIDQTDIEVDEKPRREFRKNELLYLRYRPRTWTPYGFSMLEQALLPCSIGLARQQWQWDYYQEGSIPGQFITAGPDIATPQQVRQLQDALNAMAGDVGQKHRIIVLPPGSATKDQKQINLADQFDAWITATVTMAFGLNNLDLGIIPQVTSSISSIEIREMPGANSDPASLKRMTPVLGYLKSALFDNIIQKKFRQDDMAWSWGLSERGSDKTDIIEQHVEQIKIGLESIDEGRIDVGRAPWGLPETSSPMAWTATGPIPLATLTSQTGEADVRPWSSPTGRKPTDEELNTPAHGGSSSTGPAPTPVKAPVTPPTTQGPGKPPVAKPEPAMPSAKKSLDVELAVLGRYLRKGRPLGSFVPTVLSDAALQAAVGAETVDVALESIREAMEPVLDESEPV